MTGRTMHWIKSSISTISGWWFLRRLNMLVERIAPHSRGFFIKSYLPESRVLVEAVQARAPAFDDRTLDETQCAP